jgi:hypothetical protein
MPRRRCSKRSQIEVIVPPSAIEVHRVADNMQAAINMAWGYLGSRFSLAEYKNTWILSERRLDLE